MSKRKNIKLAQAREIMIGSATLVEGYELLSGNFSSAGWTTLILIVTFLLAGFPLMLALFSPLFGVGVLASWFFKGRYLLQWDEPERSISPDSQHEALIIAISPQALSLEESQ